MANVEMRRVSVIQITFHWHASLRLLSFRLLSTREKSAFFSFLPPSSSYPAPSFCSSFLTSITFPFWKCFVIPCPGSSTYLKFWRSFVIDSFAFWNLYREHFFYFMRNNVYSERWIFSYRNYSRLIIIKKELKKNGIIDCLGYIIRLRNTV